MFATLEHVVMKIFMFTWVRVSPNSWRGYPRPKGDSPVRTEGPNPYKTVLSGSGIMIGYGVASHELALGGSLARGLTAATQRGTEVHTVTAPGFTARRARSRLTKQLLEDAHIIVLSFGTFEILTLMPPERWGAQLDALVKDVLAKSAPRAEVFLVDCNTPKMSTFTAAYQQRIARTAAEFNEQVQSIALRYQQVHRLEFRPVAEDAEDIEGRLRYQDWASSLLPAIVTRLLLDDPRDGA